MSWRGAADFRCSLTPKNLANAREILQRCCDVRQTV